MQISYGAGFPGLAVKITRVRAAALDSLEKELSFLSFSIRISITHMCTHPPERRTPRATARSESRTHPPHFTPIRLSTTLHSRANAGDHNSEIFDCVTARSISALNILLEYCLPFVKTGGVFIAMKEIIRSRNAMRQRALAVLGAGY